jgi:L-ribulose-5-phosphate 4-epimerase
LVIESNLEGLKNDLLSGAERLLKGNVLSATKHGNMSARLPNDREKILITGSPSLSIGKNDFAVVDLDGKLLAGELKPISLEVVGMHTVIYKSREDVNCVIHTHSPHSTAFAVASKQIDVVYEGMIRWGITKPIPVAGYGPRGSEVSITNIKNVIGDNKACLLENHGLLAFSENVMMTTNVIFAMEEAAQMSILASSIGQPKLISQSLIGTTMARAKEFERKGVQTAVHDH